MTKNQELKPILIKTKDRKTKEIPGEQIVWFNNKNKTLINEKPGKVEKMGASLQHYLLAFNRTYTGKIDTPFIFEDHTSGESYEYEVHYKIWFEQYDRGRWKNGCETLLSGESPKKVIEELILNAIESASGLDGAKLDESREKYNFFLEAMREDPSENDKKSEFGEKLNEILRNNGFIIEIKLEMIHPELIPVDFDFQISTPLNNFPGKIIIHVKGCIETEENSTNLARIKHYLIREYIDNIPEMIKEYFAGKLSINQLEKGYSQVTKTITPMIDQKLKNIGHKLTYLNFSNIDANILPEKNIKADFIVECTAKEFTKKVPFHCELELKQNNSAKIMKWKGNEEVTDWAKRIVADTITNTKYDNILDHDFKSGWEDFNARFIDCGYQVEKNGFKIMPDIEPIRMKKRGFRLDFESEFTHCSYRIPLKLNIFVEGKIVDGTDSFDKMKTILLKENIIDQIKLKINETVKMVINSTNLDKVYGCLKDPSNKDGRALRAKFIEVLSQVLIKEFHVKLNQNSFSVKLLDSFMTRRESILMSGLHETNFSIYANENMDQNVKNEFKLTFIIDSIPEDGLKKIAEIENRFSNTEDELEAIQTMIKEYVKAKILNSENPKISEILQEANKGNEEIGKFLLESKALQQNISNFFGVNVKFNSIRKLNIQTERNKETGLNRIESTELAILNQLQEQVLVLHERRKDLYSTADLNNPGLKKLTETIEKLENQISNYSKKNK
jgi:hypothetical protein